MVEKGGITMTLIECFDREPVDNVIACLRLRPEKVIFLGNEKDMELPDRKSVV